MTRLELLEFQRVAANKLATGALAYYTGGPDRIGGRDVPFVGQLKAVTGAGKTPILVDVVGKLGPAIVLWTTKYGAVVDQTIANLRPGGRYHHLFAQSGVEVLRLSDIASVAEWDEILERTQGLTVLVSTVAAWNSTEADPRLNVHRVAEDWGDRSRWERLKADRQRPLWVVYDEAHNTTSDQVEQLDGLDPAGFFVASASNLRGQLQLYLSSLPDDVRTERIVPVSTRAVVEAGLLKSTVSLSDYDSSPEEMIADAVKLRASLAKQMASQKAPVVPKAIYVVEASNTKTDGGGSRPTTIWRNLVSGGVRPDTIAVCTDTRDLPKDALKVKSIDQLGDDYTHIIFNKKLQEGWDDPSVYVCYLDGKTDSATRIQQVLGRALRQPGAKHFSKEALNTAHFFVNTPNEALEGIIDKLKEELRIYKDANAPDDFEPVRIVERKRVPAPIAVRAKWAGKLVAPQLQLELPPTKTKALVDLISRKTFDFSEDDRAAAGKALVSVVSVKTGDVKKLKQRDLLEDMRVRCGAYLHGTVRQASLNAANAIPTTAFANDRLNKTACLGSPALQHYYDLAQEVVDAYETHVGLKKLADLDSRDYIVGPYQPSGAVMKAFKNSAHAKYDAKSFNNDELAMAKALDKHAQFTWARNKDRLDYGIALPIKSGSSSMFYPDFLWWVKKTVWAIDPTGKFILEEKIRNKLLVTPAPLKIALVTRGKLDRSYAPEAADGWTLVRWRTGSVRPEIFSTLDGLLEALIEDS